MVSSCLCLNSGDGEEVFDGFRQKAVAVDPVFFEGGNGFRGIGLGELAVSVYSQFGIGEVRGRDEGGKRLNRQVAKIAKGRD